MSVRKIDENGDWTFGDGLSDYIDKSDEVAQNVETRVREFTDDWFLDVNKGIDWIGLLGTKGTLQQILREIERVITETEGVAILKTLDAQQKLATRSLRVQYVLTTIYNQDIANSMELTNEPGIHSNWS